jgi:hypothetical protein
MVMDLMVTSPLSFNEHLSEIQQTATVVDGSFLFSIVFGPFILITTLSRSVADTPNPIL